MRGCQRHWIRPVRCHSHLGSRYFNVSSHLVFSQQHLSISNTFHKTFRNVYPSAPPQFEIKLRNQTARRGEPAVLQCEAQGEKPIGILWNMNNKRLDTKSDPRYTIREEILANGVLSDLSIKRTERSDSALFTCVATNAFGSDDTSINMIVQGQCTTTRLYAESEQSNVST